ncbi:MAG: DUF3592 domain-containing protein [Alphaproteobacteria bacterium]
MMFDSVFDSMMPYQQVLMLVGGFVCLGLGVLLAGNEVHWRRKAIRVAGIISGVRQKGNIYYPVYRYQLPGGEVYDSTSDIGSSAFQGKETGRMVPLLVLPDAPAAARAADNWAFGAVGVLLVLAGGLLVLLAFLEYPVTKMTWIVAVALFCYSGMKLQNILVPKGQRLTLAAWKAAMKQKHDADMQGIPVTRIEDMLATEGGKKTLVQQNQARRVAGPLLFGCGMLMMVAGVQFGNGVENMLKHSLMTQGQVVEMKGGTAPDSDAVFPVVSFTDAQGRTVRFQDGAGQDPPVSRVGDTVPVLYLPDDPEKTAMIDPGVMSYVVPLLFLLGGTIAAVAGALVTRRNQKDRKQEG